MRSLLVISLTLVLGLIPAGASAVSLRTDAATAQTSSGQTGQGAPGSQSAGLPPLPGPTFPPVDALAGRGLIGLVVGIAVAARHRHGPRPVSP
jgi:hypothetical protein